MSKEYADALSAHNAAFTEFDAVRAEYRARKIGDAAFLVAQQAYKEATKVYDAAFDKEAA